MGPCSHSAAVSQIMSLTDIQGIHKGNRVVTMLLQLSSFSGGPSTMRFDRGIKLFDNIMAMSNWTDDEITISEERYTLSYPQDRRVFSKESQDSHRQCCERRNFRKIVIFNHKFNNVKNWLNNMNLVFQNRELNKFSIHSISGQIYCSFSKLRTNYPFFTISPRGDWPPNLANLVGNLGTLY